MLVSLRSIALAKNVATLQMRKCKTHLLHTASFIGTASTHSPVEAFTLITSMIRRFSEKFVNVEVIEIE